MTARSMTLRTLAGVAALALAMVATTLPGAAHAADPAPKQEIATLKVDHAWIRLLPAGLPAAGYMDMANTGDMSRKLVSVDSDDFGHVMLHQSMQSSGMSHMRHVDGIDIPALGNAALAPGGYHLMLMQPKRALEVGQTVTLVLHFADGATQAVAFEVKAANASGE